MNGVKADYPNTNEEKAPVINTLPLTDKEKLYAGYSESELDAPLSEEMQEQTSVMDDYNAIQTKEKENKSEPLQK